MVLIIELIVGNYFATLFLIGLIVAWIKIIRAPKPVSKEFKIEKFFSEYLLYAVGINNIINFIFHVFFGEMAAKFIGWADSPFQAEVGYASLGIGIAGIMSYKRDFSFRLATLIPPVVFGLGAAYGHVYEMIVNKNFSPGNVGIVLPIDIILPLAGLYLARLSHKHPYTSRPDKDSHRF